MDKGDDGGPFGRRYLIVSALRITGPVDLAALQGALDGPAPSDTRYRASRLARSSTSA